MIQDQRFYDAEAKIDAVFMALRCLVEVQSPATRTEFVHRLQGELARASDIGLATVAPDSYFKELRHQVDLMLENLE